MRFTIIESKGKCLDGSFFAEYGESASELFEIIESFRELSEQTGAQCAYYICGDFVLVRIFDEGRYVFVFPIPYNERADIEGCKASLLMLADYVSKEMLPFYISDIDRDSLPLLSELFERTDVSAYPDDEDMFFAEVVNECRALAEVPSLSLDDLTLAPLCEKYKEEYYYLCTDKGVNRFWGYDFSIDMPNAKAEDFLRVSTDEFDNGTALSMAVLYEGRFVGEAVLHGFDYRGSALAAIRLLPCEQGRGIGKKTLEALIELSRSIGLLRIKAEIFSENKASVSMTEKYMKKERECDGKVYFLLDLF